MGVGSVRLAGDLDWRGTGGPIPKVQLPSETLKKGVERKMYRSKVPTLIPRNTCIGFANGSTFRYQPHCNGFRVGAEP